MYFPILSEFFELIDSAAKFDQATARMKGLGLSHEERAEYVAAASDLAVAGMEPWQIRMMARMWAMYGGKAE